MSFLDRLIYKNPDTTTKVPVETPKIEPLVTEQVAIPVNNYTYAPAIPTEEMEKCKNYFSKLLEEAKGQNKLYNQLLTSIETISKTDPTQPISNIVKFAFSFLKMQNNTLTKEVLLQDINNALISIVNDKSTSFKTKQDKRQKEGVDDNNKMVELKSQQIQQKQLEIQKLNEEIQQLQTTIIQNKQIIDNKDKCYDVVSNQVINKVKEEIGLITNFI